MQGGWVPREPAPREGGEAIDCVRERHRWEAREADVSGDMCRAWVSGYCVLCYVVVVLGRKAMMGRMTGAGPSLMSHVPTS